MVCDLLIWLLYFICQQNQLAIVACHNILLMLHIQQPDCQSQVVDGSTCSQNNETEQISVYLRQTSKIGVKILIPNKINVIQIMAQAQTQFKIPVQKQILFVASKKYTKSEDTQLKLQQGSIIHVHSIDQLNFNELTIFFQQISKEGQISKPVQFKVKSNQNIIDFIKQKLQSSEVFLIESGRKLDLQKSFKSNDVSNGSTISYTYTGKQLNHDEFQKDFNKLFQQEDQPNEKESQQSKKQMQQQMAAKAKQWKQKKLETKSKKVAKLDSSQSDGMQNFQPKPNFKKKKTICLKAVKINPQNNQYIWKRDSSFSMTKNQNKRLKKVIKGRKKRQSIKSQSKKSVENQVMTKNVKIRLRQQMQKLFTTDSLGLGLRPSQKNKPIFIQNSQPLQRKIQQIF